MSGANEELKKQIFIMQGKRLKQGEAGGNMDPSGIFCHIRVI